MAPRKNNTVYEHFKSINGKWQCNMCNKDFNGDRTYNLKNHLVKVHNLELCSNISGASTSAIAKPLKKQSFKIEINKNILYRSYIGLVTEDSVPLNVLNSPNFRNIVDPICAGLSEKLGKKITLNSHNCKATLKDVANNIKHKIKSEVRHRLVSLKIDSATRLTRNIFGISAQYIQDDEIKSRILGMAELKGVSASASKNLATEILKTLDKYDINLRQIVSITSDNAANMIKTSKILSQSVINVEDGNEDDSNEIYLENITTLECSSSSLVGDIQICRCAAHTAQLVALDILKDAEVKNFVLTCRNLTKHVRKPSNGFRDLFELRNFQSPKLDCPTRWGSTYGMVESLISAKDIIKNIESVKNKSKEENFEINDELWTFMEIYRDAFAPLQKTIKKFQEEQLHYGDFYAQWLKCKILTTKYADENKNNANPLTVKIANCILESIEKRTKMLLSNEGINACLFLDPRFHRTLCLTKKQSAISYLKQLWEKFRVLNIVSENTTQDENEVNANCNQFNDEEDEILNEFLTQEVHTTHAEQVDVHTKIENLQLPFARSDTNILEFWKVRKHSDPELYVLSNICFGIPPTQVSIERAFSSLKLILADNRNQLSHETLENILIVKLNPKFLDEAIDTLPIFEDII